jgi:hypothetical protein
VASALALFNMSRGSLGLVSHFDSGHHDSSPSSYQSMIQKMTRPHGVCSVCGDLAVFPGEINKPCLQVYVNRTPKRHCRGIYEAAIKFNWSECTDCEFDWLEGQRQLQTVSW